MNWSKFKTKKFYTVGAVAFIAVLFFGVLMPIALYLYNPLEKITKPIFKILPYPVAIIDGNQIITTKTLIADTESIRHFYESQDFSSAGMRIDFSTEEGGLRLKIKEKEVLDKLIEDAIIKKTANKYGIIVSKEDVEREMTALADENGSLEVLETNLKNLYGWDLEQFKKKVISSQIYLKKMIDYYIEKEKNSGEEWNQVQEAREKIAEDGSNFCEIVKSYSKGETADNCGEIGWFQEQHLEPEIASVVLKMKVGEVSDVIKSSLGYHIVLLDEIKQSEKDGSKINEIKLKQIFINNGGFVKWMKENKKKHNIWVPTKDYRWNQDGASIKFQNNQLETKEHQLRIKSEGDPIFY